MRNSKNTTEADKMRVAIAAGVSLATVTKWFKTRGEGMNRVIAERVEAEAVKLGLVATTAKAVA